MNYHNRFKDAPWYSHGLNQDIIVGGAGGIGSWLTVLLSRAGFSPQVFDFDTLETHNIGGQLYFANKIGKPKIEALKEVVASLNGVSIAAYNEMITSSTSTSLHAFSAFDNMRARRDMFTKWNRVVGDYPQAIYIDGRLEAEYLKIYCVTGGKDKESLLRREIYEREHLEDDSEIEEASCTMKQTSHAAAMIASHMVGFYTNFVANVLEEENNRFVPFSWEYFIPMNLITQEENLSV